MARSRMGYRLAEALLEAYRKDGRPGKAWRFVSEHVTALEDADLTFKLAHVQLVLGMVGQSVDLFQGMLDRRILRQSVIEAPIAVNLIDALNRQERYGRAISVYESLAKADLSEPIDSLHYNAGNSYLGAERPDDALRCYEAALKIRAENAGHGNLEHSYILHNMGNCYYDLHDDDTAITYYESALSHAVTPADMAYEECAIGDAHYAQGRRDTALHYYRRAADHDSSVSMPTSASLRLGVDVMALPVLKERVQEALFLQAVAWRVDRSRMGGRLARALLRTYKAIGRPGRQWRRLQRYVDDLGDDELSFELSCLQLEFGMTGDSIVAFQRLLDRAILLGATVDPALISNLIDALNTAERYGDAIEVFESVVPAVGLAGSADAIHYNAGISYYETGRFTDAVRCYQTALGLRSTDTCHILHNLGNCYSALGDEKAALNQYRLALGVAATDAERSMEEYAMGISSAELGRHEDAKRYYSRAADRGHEKARERLTEMRIHRPRYDVKD